MSEQERETWADGWHAGFESRDEHIGKLMAEVERLQSCLYAQEEVKPLYDEIERLRSDRRAAADAFSKLEAEVERLRAERRVIPGTNIPDADTPSY